MNNERAKLNSILFDLEEDSRLNYEKTATLMRFAAQIDDALKAKGMSQRDLATKLGKQPSVISKWLSGTHNFTADTLMDIQDVLDIELIKRERRAVYSIAKQPKTNKWFNISNSTIYTPEFC